MVYRHVSPVTTVSGISLLIAAGLQNDWNGVFDISTTDGHNEVIIDRNGVPVELSDREIEILRLILEGNTSKETADILCCSKRTVDFYLGRIYEKLDVSNRVQAMRRISLLGLMSLVEGEKDSQSWR